MGFWRATVLAICLGVSVYLNRTSFALDADIQIIAVLISIVMLLTCLISMLAAHRSITPASRKTGIVIGWAITLVLAFETLGAVINFQLRAEVAESIESTTFASVTYDPEGLFVLDGLIGADTTSSLQNLIALLGAMPLVVNSGGGSLEAASDIAKLVSDHDQTVIIATECSSACVLVAIASSNLLALPESKFGFHQGSIFGDNQSDMAKFWAQSANETLMLALEKGGIPESILAVARQTPPEEMHYVSAKQMRALGIVKSILE